MSKILSESTNNPPSYLSFFHWAGNDPPYNNQARSTEF